LPSAQERIIDIAFLAATLLITAFWTRRRAIKRPLVRAIRTIHYAITNLLGFETKLAVITGYTIVPTTTGDGFPLLWSVEFPWTKIIFVRAAVFVTVVLTGADASRRHAVATALARIGSGRDTVVLVIGATVFHLSAYIVTVATETWRRASAGKETR